MPLSPLVLVSDNSGPFVPTPNGVNVGPGDNIQIMLQNPTGVGTWFLIIFGTDELSSPPTLTNVNPGNGQVTSPTSIVSFTYPGTPAGRSLVFQSTVVSGSNSAQTTFGIYSLTPNGDRVGAVGETREGSTNFGWAALLNPILRSGAAYLYYNDGLMSPPTGANTIQGAIDYVKSHSSGGGGGSLGDNASALRMGPQRRYLADDQDDFLMLTETGLTDTDTTSSYAGGDLVLSENKLYYSGTLSGTEGAIFSYDIAADRVQQVNNGNSGNITPPGPHNPSGITSFGYPFGNTFQFHFVGKAGLLIALDGELPFDSNTLATYSSGAEDWTGGRLTYVYQDESGFAVNVFWTAPLVDKVYVTAAQGNGVNLAYTATSGSHPTAICTDSLTNVWVSLYATGQVLRFSTTQTDQTLTLTGTFSVPSVVDMISDGQFIWCLSDTNVLTKLDMNGVVKGSYSGSSLSAVTKRSRMAFDGLTIWVTNGTSVSRFTADNIGALFVDGFSGATEFRGITVDRNGVVYLAFMRNPGPTLDICYFNPPTGTRPKIRSGYSQAFFTAPSAHLPFNVLTLVTPTDSSGFGLGTGVYYEITAIASQVNSPHSGSAFWKKVATIGGAGDAQVGLIEDLIPPRITSQATSDGLTFSLNFAASVLTGTINQTGSGNTYQWTFEIKEVRANFGQF